MDIERAADILGVEVDASDEEIERRYRELSKKVHPDQGGSAKLFIQITQAKKTLLSNTEIKDSSQKQSTESTSNSKSNNTNRRRQKRRNTHSNRTNSSKTQYRTNQEATPEGGSDQVNESDIGDVPVIIELIGRVLFSTVYALIPGLAGLLLSTGIQNVGEALVSLPESIEIGFIITKPVIVNFESIGVGVGLIYGFSASIRFWGDILDFLKLYRAIILRFVALSVYTFTLWFVSAFILVLIGIEDTTLGIGIMSIVAALAIIDRYHVIWYRESDAQSE